MKRDNVVRVTAAILRKGDRLLLAKRPHGFAGAGFWEFPGGKVRSGESLKGCLEREILEEMGIRIRALREVGRVLSGRGERAIELIAFECEILEGEPANIECADHRWVPLEEVGDYDLLPPDRELLNRYLLPSSTD